MREFHNLQPGYEPTGESCHTGRPSPTKAEERLGTCDAVSMFGGSNYHRLTGGHKQVRSCVNWRPSPPAPTQRCGQKFTGAVGHSVFTCVLEKGHPGDCDDAENRANLAVAPPAPEPSTAQTRPSNCGDQREHMAHTWAGQSRYCPGKPAEPVPSQAQFDRLQRHFNLSQHFTTLVHDDCMKAQREIAGKDAEIEALGKYQDEIAQKWLREIKRNKAADAVIEFVRTNHNSRSDKLMELIAKYDAEAQ